MSNLSFTFFLKGSGCYDADNKSNKNGLNYRCALQAF